jgi:hypothetical protein
MAKIVTQQPRSPSGAFLEAAASLRETLGDEAATFIQVTEAYMQVFKHLNKVPIEKPVYAAALAALTANFQDVVGRSSLVTDEAIVARRGAAKDLDLHAKKVLGYAWM